MRIRSTPFMRLSSALMLLGILLAAPFVALASIDGTISGAFQMNDRRTVGLNASANIPVNAQPAITFTNGTGAGQVSGLYQSSQTFSGTTASLNFGSGGGLTDSYGTAVSWTKLKAVYVNNTGTSAITIGGGTNPITTMLNSTGTLTLPAGAWTVIATPDAAGWAITASTACNLNFTGTSGQTFQVVAAGN